MNVYFLSGLGVDERAFKKIHLPESFQIRHIHWIKPLDKENVTEYSKRLISQIDQTTPFILVGLSFGGIVAIEISNLIDVKKTILISSVSSAKQLPWYFKIAAFLKLNKILPLGLLQKSGRLFYWTFGASTKEQKELLKEINEKPDLQFTNWAVNEVINWTRKPNKLKVIQIHGTQDIIFLIHFVNADYRIKNGGHLMIFSDADLISEKLADILGSP